MRFAYLNLNEVKALIVSKKGTYDGQLLKLLESTSEQINKFTNRTFFTLENEARWFSGSGTRRLLAPDVGTLTSIEIDGTAITLGDEIGFYPWNGIEHLGLERIANGAVFPLGVRNIKVTGSWGYINYLEPQDWTLSTSSANVRTATVSSADHTIFPGDTLRCGTEQLYVTDVDVATLKVLRAVHGSVAEVHAGSDIDIYRYPNDIALALGTQVRRWQTRAQTGFADEVGSTETGITRFSLGISSEVRSVLAPYRLYASLAAV